MTADIQKACCSVENSMTAARSQTRFDVSDLFI